MQESQERDFMEDSQFKKAELEDKEIISHYFKHHTSRSCERTFVNVYLWSRQYPVKWAVIEGALVFKSQDEDHLSYAFPAGEDEAVQKALEQMMEFSERNGFPFSMYNVTPADFERLERWYPGRFQIEYDRDQADYVYESEKLITLAGKKLHGKRNHINKFKNTYGDDWSYEPIHKENLEECFQMALKWRNDNGCNDDEEKYVDATQPESLKENVLSTITSGIACLLKSTPTLSEHVAMLDYPKKLVSTLKTAVKLAPRSDLTMSVIRIMHDVSEEKWMNCRLEATRLVLRRCARRIRSVHLRPC